MAKQSKLGMEEGTSQRALPRVLFARVGRMLRYSGPREGDERPKGGGRYNATALGHEAFNFADFGGTLYGFIQPSRSKAKAINLKRIDPGIPLNQNSLDGVLVIFVARFDGAQRVVGWYREAVLHRTRVPFPTLVKKRIGDALRRSGINDSSFTKFTARAETSNAMLLPSGERLKSTVVPRKGGMGQANVCYMFDPAGKPKVRPWMTKALQFVGGYNKANLLSDPNAESVSQMTAEIEQEQAAGFQSNPGIRDAVEERAMKLAHSKLAQLGYSDIRRTAEFESFDYTCEKDGKKYFVEVKGTQTIGKSFIFTRAEVEHATRHPETTILVLVSGVKVKQKPMLVAMGGTVHVYERWTPAAEDLRVIQYIWTPRADALAASV